MYKQWKTNDINNNRYNVDEKNSHMYAALLVTNAISTFAANGCKTCILETWKSDDGKKKKEDIQCMNK
jgi:hypothetical protein